MQYSETELKLEASDEGSLFNSDSNHEENITAMADKSESEVTLKVNYNGVQGAFNQIESE